MQQERTYLIIGGVGGIGEALARKLRTAGHQVTLTSRSLERAEALANDIGASPATADIDDPASIEAAVEAASNDGHLHGLVYCAGSIPLKPFARITAEDMLDAYRLNTVGAALAIQAAIKPLKMAEGSAVLFSSVAASQGFANHAAIASAKAGVEGLILALAAELAPEIRVNAIAPSLTDTPLAESLTRHPKMVEAIAALHPIPRLGQADEMAEAAIYLLSNAAGWMTGQVLHVDGGRSTLRVGKS